jgi:hypothetical protein
LMEGVSEDVANIVFNKVACKVIKDAVKHACLVSIFVFYTQVLKQKMKPTLAHGIYLTKEQHLQGESIGWSRIWRPRTGYAGDGRPRSSEPSWSETDRTG